MMVMTCSDGRYVGEDSGLRVAGNRERTRPSNRLMIGSMVRRVEEFVGWPRFAPPNNSANQLPGNSLQNTRARQLHAIISDRLRPLAHQSTMRRIKPAIMSIRSRNIKGNSAVGPNSAILVMSFCTLGSSSLT